MLKAMNHGRMVGARRFASREGGGYLSEARGVALATGTAPRRQKFPRANPSRMTAFRALCLAIACLACRDDASGSRLGRLAESARVREVEGPAPATSPASLLRDSSGADSVALASLPAAIRADFDVAAELQRARRNGEAESTCREISDSSEVEIRKRVRVQETDNLLILFVRAHRRSGELKRVELLRRAGQRPQRAWVWDVERAELEAIEWTNGRQQAHTVPPGTPTPRALRALGRRLLVLDCA